MFEKECNLLAVIYHESENLISFAARRMLKCVYIMFHGNRILGSVVNLTRNVHRS
jgi:hypothetical protein